MVSTSVKRKKCIILNIENNKVVKKYNNIEDFNREINYIPILHKIKKISPHIAIPNEYKSNCIFYDYLGEPLQTKLPLLNVYDTICVLYQVFYTIKCMVDNGFKHRDLHLSNILILYKPNQYIYDICLYSNYFTTIIDFDQSCLSNDKSYIQKDTSYIHKDISCIHKEIRGKGKQSHLFYTNTNDFGKHDIATFSVKFIQNSPHLTVRKLIIDILGDNFIKIISKLYVVNTEYNLIYRDIYGRDYRFLNYTYINDIYTIMDKLNYYIKNKLYEINK